MKHTRLIYISLLCVATIFFIFVPSKISSVFLYGIIIATVFSVLFCFFTFMGIRTEDTLISPVIFRNEKARFKITFKSVFPFTFSYITPVFDTHGALEKSDTLTIASPSFNPVIIEYSLTYPHCGDYTIGFSYIKITDMLGILSLKKKVKHTEYIKVMPKTHKISNFPIDALSEASKATPVKTRSSDFADFAGIHDYSGNETMKQIHWNLSMKQQKLIVKEYEDELKRLITLSLIPGGVFPETNILDKMLELTVSLTKYARENGSFVNLQIGGGFGKSVENMKATDFASLLLKKSSVLFSKSFSVKDMPLKDDGVQVFISAEITQLHLDTVLKSSVKGAGKIFIFISENPSSEDKALAERFERCRVKVFILNASKDKLGF